MDVIGNIRNIWNSQNTKLTNLTESKIIEVGKVINDISKDKDLDLNISNKNLCPSLVVVGSQSSGKSSVLNGILSMDILPTGSSMVTRTPLNLNLIQTETDMFAEFGKYNNGCWIPTKSIKLTNPLPIKEEVKQIHIEIQRQTLEKAGPEMNISQQEINLKIYSPYVPNLNLVDLPGLTMVACTDKGQPQDIKLRIRNLITSYIKKENNIILCVMQAREDVEADVALDLCKEHDKTGERTIGILTKVDLMNRGNSIINYLNNNISKDLMLKYGYYGVKNRSRDEMLEKDIHTGFQDEINFFNNDPSYKNIINKERLGVVNMSKQISSILMESIKSKIPEILKEITRIQYTNTKNLSNLGDPVPTDNNTKLSLMNNIVNILTSNFIDNIEKRGSEINTGRKLKDIFIEFRNQVMMISPFNNDECSDDFLIEIVKNCEGNHMSFPTPTIEVLENCLLDNKVKPFEKLLPLSLKCVKDINTELTNLLNILLDNNYINRFPKLVSIIREIIINDVFNKHQKIAIKKIEELVDMEENYIWIDDSKFLESLKSMTNSVKSNNDIQLLRKLLNDYFRCIVSVIQHTIPKSIMLFLVNKSKNELQTLLFSKINKKEYLEHLIEDPNQNNLRIKYTSFKEKLNNARKILESL
jgi:dynamin 1-like protein